VLSVFYTTKIKPQHRFHPSVIINLGKFDIFNSTGDPKSLGNESDIGIGMSNWATKNTMEQPKPQSAKRHSSIRQALRMRKRTSRHEHEAMVSGQMTGPVSSLPPHLRSGYADHLRKISRTSWDGEELRRPTPLPSSSDSGYGSLSGSRPMSTALLCQTITRTTRADHSPQLLLLLVRVTQQSTTPTIHLHHPHHPHRQYHTQPCRTDATAINSTLYLHPGPAPGCTQLTKAAPTYIVNSRQPDSHHAPHHPNGPRASTPRVPIPPMSQEGDKTGFS
jgi:hypothetical protein